MAKQNHNTTPAPAATPAAGVRYVGPEYQLGVGIPEQSRLVRPAHMTDEERIAFVELYPQYAVWWVSIEGTEPPASV